MWEWAGERKPKGILSYPATNVCPGKLLLELIRRVLHDRRIWLRAWLSSKAGGSAVVWGAIYDGGCDDIFAAWN